MPRLSLGLRLDEINTLGGAVYTHCFTPLEQTGDLLHGTLIPGTTSDGTVIYAHTLNVATGEIIFKFGVAGDEQLVNNVQIIYKYDSDNAELFWDDTLKYYIGVNVELAQSMQLEVGEDVCFAALAIPLLLVHYDYAAVEVE